MNIALVGATGMVGRTMIQVLEERNIPFTNFYPIASERSKGKKVYVKGKEYTAITLEDSMDIPIDFALFSAGGSISTEWAPKFAKMGTVVIDNSSAWRMDPQVPLVVPQINGTQSSGNKIIANPNCSTIQLVMVLNPLHSQNKIKRIVISTYQSVTGTGKAAVEQMQQERSVGSAESMVYAHPIDKNCIPHCDIFLENGYTKEEMKLVNETQKIIGDSSIKLTATAVRVPVVGGHSESVNIEFENDFDIDQIKETLHNTEGVTVLDNPERNEYPTPLQAMNKDDVFVGRIRRDHSNSNSLNLWIVSDNLRKGAATNAVEILEHLIKK